jgi:5-methyltetrahydropteroyltriglutamate--homocysteine methyltransferase
MNSPIRRPFRADQVGSFLRPEKLLSARQKREQGHIDAAGLRLVEDDCIRELVKIQEDAGLEGITDGELRRQSWNADFLAGFRNVKKVAGNLPLYHRNPDGTITTDQISAWQVSGKIDRKHPIQVDDFAFLKRATRRTAKTCVPSPTLLHFRGGRKAIDKTAYPDMNAFFADVAHAYNAEMNDLYAAGCRYLQFDDTNFAYLCDPIFRDAATQMGEDPAKLIGTYCKLINDSIANRPADMLAAIHLCRGNSSSGGAATGSYEIIAEELFTTLNVDAFFLEYDDERAGGFEPLRFMPRTKCAVLGVVTTKRPELESKDALKRRLDEAAKHLPLENLCISPQCGFASVGTNRLVDFNDQLEKIRLLVDVGHDVWGGM